MSIKKQVATELSKASKNTSKKIKSSRNNKARKMFDRIRNKKSQGLILMIEIGKENFFCTNGMTMQEIQDVILDSLVHILRIKP